MRQIDDEHEESSIIHSTSLQLIYVPCIKCQTFDRALGVIHTSSSTGFNHWYTRCRTFCSHSSTVIDFFSKGDCNVTPLGLVECGNHKQSVAIFASFIDDRMVSIDLYTEKYNRTMRVKKISITIKLACSSHT